MENLIWVPDAAKELNVSPSTIYSWEKAGKISLVKKSYKERYMLKEDVDRIKSEQIPKGMKKCKYCDFMGNVTDFAKGRLRCNDCHQKYEKDRWGRNAEKHAAYKKERYEKVSKEADKKRANDWYYRNKDRVKAKNIERLYGISNEEYEEMQIRCNNRCELCQKIVDKLCVDHNHTTGKIRGLLCVHCNSLVGYCKEDQQILLSAIDYLKKYNE